MQNDKQPSRLRLLFITADPAVASFVTQRGADRIFVDLEIIGKIERQGHLDTVISRHRMEDISLLRPLVPVGSLLVRLNPVHSGTDTEIEEAIERGADTLMLPMFRGPKEVRRFCEAVNSRVKVCLLVETVGAMETLSDCISIPGVDEVHIGLNDLHLEMGCRFMFEPLASGHVERMAETLKSAGVPFGIGGLARVGEGLLPAELLMAEHVRLGSTGAILSRTFHRQARNVKEIQDHMDFRQEVEKLHQAYQLHGASSPEALEMQHVEMSAVIARITAKLPKKQRTIASGK